MGIAAGIALITAVAGSPAEGTTPTACATPAPQIDPLAMRVAEARNWSPAELRSMAIPALSARVDAELAEVKAHAPKTPEMARRIEKARVVGNARGLSITMRVWSCFLKVLASGYQREMSHDELEAALAFWSSPAGQKTREKVLTELRKTGGYMGAPTVYSDDEPAALLYFNQMGKREDAVDRAVMPPASAYLAETQETLRREVTAAMIAALSGRG